MTHRERHATEHLGWLRAAVLGANDGLISTASLVLGVAAAGAGIEAVAIAGIAGLLAGALSMAAGEYVSVSSQADAEAAMLAREVAELDADPEGELAELAALQVQRGLPPELALEVARALSRHDALGAHARDELGLHPHQRARPLQAAAASAAAFAAGAGLPLGMVLLAGERVLPWGLVVTSVLSLGALGALAAWIGRAPPLRGALRVAFWGALAMGITHLAGALFGAHG